MTIAKERIREFISSVIYRQFADDEPLVAKHILDSMALVELVLKLEAEYGVKIYPLEMTAENFDSVGAIIRLLERKQAAAGGSSKQ